jgi:hypothetical protein
VRDACSIAIGKLGHAAFNVLSHWKLPPSLAPIMSSAAHHRERTLLEDALGLST